MNVWYPVVQIILVFMRLQCKGTPMKVNHVELLPGNLLEAKEQKLSGGSTTI